MINLHSDTQTRPSEGMRQAMAHAEVGDEQRFLDPTVNALQDRVAELLGHEAALFLPTGTLCNAISFRLHLRPGGDEVLLDRSAHPIIAEAGSPAALSHAMTQKLEGDGGILRRSRWRRGSATRPTATCRARGSCRWSRPPTWAAEGCGRSRRSRGGWRGRGGTDWARTWTAPGS